MLLAYPFFGIFGSMVVFFLWVVWFWLVFSVFRDLFRRDDIGGGSKVLWMILVIIVPLLGAFIYFIANDDGMTQRTLERRRYS